MALSYAIFQSFSISTPVLSLETSAQNRHLRPPHLPLSDRIIAESKDAYAPLANRSCKPESPYYRRSTRRQETDGLNSIAPAHAPKIKNPLSIQEIFMVEVRGIEPLSEKATAKLSPSAVCVFTFPLPSARRQAQGFSSFMMWPCGKA